MKSNTLIHPEFVTAPVTHSTYYKINPLVPNLKSRKKRIGDIEKSYGKTIILENSPISGFAISNCTRNAKGMIDGFLIIDPRGYQFTIDTANMFFLTMESYINEGVINDQCVWGSAGIKNMLLPIDSESYREALAYTNIKNNRTFLRDIDVGDKVLLQNGLTGHYLGKWRFIDSPKLKYKNMKRTYHLDNCQDDYVIELIAKNGMPVGYYHMGHITVSEVIAKGTYALTDSEDIRAKLNKDLNGRVIGFTDNAFLAKRRIDTSKSHNGLVKRYLLITNDKKCDFKMSLAPSTADEVNELIVNGDYMNEHPIVKINDTYYRLFSKLDVGPEEEIEAKRALLNYEDSTIHLDEHTVPINKIMDGSEEYFIVKRQYGTEFY